jgi:hypothetical protein
MMQISGAGMIFLFGCAGGALLELLRWWKLRESPNFPVYARRPVYWLLTIAMIAAGGFIAAVYGPGPLSAVQAMNLGAAAPAIIGALAAKPSTGGMGGTRSFDGSTPLQSRIRQFLTFG